MAILTGWHTLKIDDVLPTISTALRMYAAEIENRREVVRRLGLQAKFAKQGRERIMNVLPITMKL